MNLTERQLICRHLNYGKKETSVSFRYRGRRRSACERFQVDRGRVLGGYGVTSEKVRERVQASAKALKYRANELARSMTTGKSKTIGVVVGDIENSFFGIAVRSITDVANASGFM